MRLGVFAKTFDGEDPAIVLAACRNAGFETVQYNMSCGTKDWDRHSGRVCNLQPDRPGP